jgi:hypothetical protein
VTARFRHNFAVPIAALLALFGTSALALQSWWLAPLLLIPLAVLWWALRSGVDADGDTLRVRGMVGSRVVPWSNVDGFRVDGRRAVVTLVGGGEIPLPGVTAAELPTLIAASGHPISSENRDPQ